MVDEFQRAPALWDEYLSRIRKYGGSYVLAAQGLATVDRVQRDLHKVVVGNTGTHVAFRTPDPDEAAYLAAVLDNAVAAEAVQIPGLRQCYIKTSDAGGPLPVVSATLPPPPRGNGGTARLIAAACARRYGRPIANVLAARDHWMTDLFYAAAGERRRDADNAGGVGSAPHTADPTLGGDTTMAGVDGTAGEQDEAAGKREPPSTTGMHGTQAGARDTGRPRRKRRRNRLSVATDRPTASLQPVASAAATAQQLSLRLDSDDASRCERRRGVSDAEV